MISDYFKKYHAPFIRHLKRHFKGSDILGSKFTGARFPTIKEVIDYAYAEIAPLYDSGKKLVIERTFPQIIGLEGIIALSDLPSQTQIYKESREKEFDSFLGRQEEYEVNVVYGIQRKTTNNLVIVAGPIPASDPVVHTFLSIYPGRYAPDFDDSKFWNEHAFINEKRL